MSAEHSIQFKRPHTGQCFDDGASPVLSVDFNYDEIDARLAADPVQKSAQGRLVLSPGSIAQVQPGEIHLSPEELDEMLGKAREAGAKKMLDFIITSDNSSPKVIGCRTLVASYLLRGSRWANQKQLATKMRVSPGRVSQYIKAARYHMDFLNAILTQRSKAGVHKSGIDHGKS